MRSRYQHTLYFTAGSGIRVIATRFQYISEETCLHIFLVCIVNSTATEHVLVVLDIKTGMGAQMGVIPTVPLGTKRTS